MQAAQSPQPVIPPPPAIPAPPAVPGTPVAQGGGSGGSGGGTVVIARNSTPNAIYEALRHQRRELNDQLERLEDQREELAQQMRGPGVTDVDKKGLEQRIAATDVRITDIERQIADADANVARAAAQPGAVLPPPPPRRDPGPPEEFWVLSGIALFVIGLPLTIAYARRIWRRGAGVVTGIPQEIYDRFNKLDHAVDAIAIEVERVGEGQRYLTRVHADQQRALAAGAAQRVETVEREKEAQARK